MSYYPPNNGQMPKKLVSPFSLPPMTPEQRAAYERDCNADWRDTFGGSSTPRFEGPTTQPPIRWNQFPSSAGPSYSATAPAPSQQPNPAPQIPSRARGRPSQPGEGVFQAVVSPTPTAPSSWEHPQPPVQGM
ncbi:hypothetical protein FRC01_005607, partial [Tulasnella sp. 417]